MRSAECARSIFLRCEPIGGKVTRGSTVRPFLLVAVFAAPLRAQTIDDGMLLPRRVLGTGLFYAHDGWNRYWEGGVRRENGNIGTVTTQSVTWVMGYGVTDRLSVMTTGPYVWTHGSQGPLHGMSGLQDVTLAAKYQLVATPFTDRGTLRAMVVGAAGIPASNYVPDFLPLSIGLASRRFSGRFTLDFRAHEGWYLTGSTAYTWRTKVTLDRPAYYTNGQLYLSNEVAMPAVFDYTVSAGYQHGPLSIPVSLSQQRALGGGDIRRQDMPFVSNRMDWVKIEGLVLYRGVRLGVSRILSGRNVGQATTLTSGVFYAFHL